MSLFKFMGTGNVIFHNSNIRISGNSSFFLFLVLDLIEIRAARPFNLFVAEVESNTLEMRLTWTA